MIDESILEPIAEAVWRAKRDWKVVSKIHVTHDFYMQVKAKCAHLYFDYVLHKDFPILGYPVVEHLEACEMQWWLEFEGEGIHD